MYELQMLLTHSSPQMTQRYAHLNDDALKKVSGLAGMLFAAAWEPEGKIQQGKTGRKKRTRSKYGRSKKWCNGIISIDAIPNKHGGGETVVRHP